jgi:hypothetical protein
MNLRGMRESSILRRSIDARPRCFNRCPAAVKSNTDRRTRRRARSVPAAARVVTPCGKRNYRTSARESAWSARNARNNPAAHRDSRIFLEIRRPADRPRWAPPRPRRKPVARPLAAPRPAADSVAPVRGGAPSPLRSPDTADRLGAESTAAPPPSTPDCSNDSAGKEGRKDVRTPSTNKDGGEPPGRTCFQKKSEYSSSGPWERQLPTGQASLPTLTRQRGAFIS